MKVRPNDLLYHRGRRGSEAAADITIASAGNYPMIQAASTRQEDVDGQDANPVCL